MLEGGGEDGDRDALARFQLALARSHRRLKDDEIAIVRERIARSLKLRQQLRAVPLDNSDEPVPGFDPNPGPSKPDQVGLVS
jgi:hypothetical protein